MSRSRDDFGGPAEHSGPRTRPEDLPLLYLLLALNLALILALPLGALRLTPLVRRLVASGSLSRTALWGMGLAGLLVEAGFIWRGVRIWARIRSVPARRPI